MTTKRTLLQVKIGNVLVKHLTRPQKQRYLVAQNDGCCLLCGHPFGTKEVRKRIGYIVKDILASIEEGI